MRCTLLEDLSGSPPTEEIHRMTDTIVSQLHVPMEDALTEVLRRGAEKLLAKAVEAEVVQLLERYEHLRLDGKQAVVRNGYLPERTVQTALAMSR